LVVAAAAPLFVIVGTVPLGLAAGNGAAFPPTGARPVIRARCRFPRAGHLHGQHWSGLALSWWVWSLLVAPVVGVLGYRRIGFIVAGTPAHVRAGAHLSQRPVTSGHGLPGGRHGGR
jgi:hypothetical protein